MQIKYKTQSAHQVTWAVQSPQAEKNEQSPHLCMGRSCFHNISPAASRLLQRPVGSAGSVTCSGGSAVGSPVLIHTIKQNKQTRRNEQLQNKHALTSRQKEWIKAV